MISQRSSLVHWNYFLALEQNVESLSRYVELNLNNFKTYSMEMAHLLLAASSEVDVVMKSLCKLLEPYQDCNNIEDYRNVIGMRVKVFSEESVRISRYGLELTPWSQWKYNKSPIWWKNYNKVKHERNNFFQEANLHNTLNAMAGLYLCNYYYYMNLLSIEYKQDFGDKQVLANLNPRSSLFHLGRQIISAHRL
jgi:hypothetical protein